MKTMYKRTLSVVFLLAVMLVCLVCPEGAKAVQTTNDTFESYTTRDGKTHVEGQGYPIPYILKNYNIFTTGDCEVSHVVGPVIVGGNFSKGGADASLGGVTTDRVDSFPHQVPSYAGSTKKAGTSISSVITVNYFNENLHFYTSENNDIDYFVSAKLDPSVINQDRTLRTDSFIQPGVMDDIVSEIGELKKKNTGNIINVLVDKTSPDYLISDELLWTTEKHSCTLYLDAGKMYNINFSELNNRGVDTINIRATSQNADVVVFTDETTVEMPHILYNKEDIGSMIEKGKNTGLVFMAPNATDFLGPKENHGGHIVAPKANVKLRDGDFAGCIIAKEIHPADAVNIGYSEGHMWPYNGQMLYGKAPVIKTGSLKVTKTVVGGTADDSQKDFSFTVTYTDKDGKTHQNEPFTLKDQESKTFTGLLAGEKYTVVETKDDLFQQTSTGAQGMIEAGKTAFAAFTNTKIPVGSLLITNTVIGSDGDKNLLFHYIVTYKGIDGKEVTEKFSLKDGEKRLIQNIPAGAACHVVEEEADQNGYTTNQKEYSIKIEANKQAKAPYVNKKPVTPAAKKTVTVKKEWVDHDNPKRPTSVQVQLYKKDAQKGKFVEDGKPVTLNANKNWQHVWDNLDTDAEYKVEEVNPPKGYDVKIKEKPEGWTITNTAAGCLTITNTVKGDGSDPNKQFSYTVTYVDENHVTQTVAEFTLANGGRECIQGIPVGVEYTITEIDANQDGYVVQDKNYQTAITKEKECVIVPFTNVKTTAPVETTSVSVVKVWKDFDQAHRPASVQVQLYKGGMAYGNPVELNAQNGWKTVWNGLDSKASWSVNELNVPEGYEKTIAQDGNNWTITNTYKEPVDEKVLKDLPQTGDSSNLKLLFALGCLSLVGVAMMVSKKR